MRARLGELVPVLKQLTWLNGDLYAELDVGKHEIR
jgi:hypothetical protein